MLTVMTRKQQLLEEFRTAGLRGLTADEMHKAVGGFWKLRLRELRDDGYVFLERRSRFAGGRTWRWTLVTEPAPAADEPCDEQLVDPPPAPPDSAIWGPL